MTPKAIVFFDLDGTLLNAQSKIDDEIVTIIQQLKDNNVLPVICTGRSGVEIIDIAKKAQIDNLITLNGQYITLNGKTIYNHPLKLETIERLTAFAKERGDEVAYYSNEAMYVSNINDVVTACYNLIDADVPDINPNYPKEHDVQMMLLFRKKDEQDNDYRNAFPELEFYRNAPVALDVITRGQSKGTGIRFLTQFLNLEHIPTYAFGDGTNDFAMFEAVEYPIAMGNAVDALKEQAVYITTKNTDHGIANGLRHFHLID